MVKMVKTHVKGFDKELGGGIPYGHLILLSGTPGTMKSTLAYSMIHENVIRDGHVGLYISFEQSKESLQFHINRSGFADIQKTKDKLFIVDLAKIRKLTDSKDDDPWMEILKKYVNYHVKKLKPNILVFDSLPILEITARMTDRRTELFHLFEWLRELETTIIIINESNNDPNTLREEDFLSDGIIHLQMTPVGDVDLQRRIRCVKMRGMDHNTSYFNLEFAKGKFRIVEAI